MAKDKGLTILKSMSDFKKAYKAKRKLIERQKEDFLYALGSQWSKDDLEALEKAKIKPVTDNRIQPNIFLLTGLERQNRSEFRAYPEGEEDSLKADIASLLFKHAIKISDFSYKSSDQFKDGVTCGESHLELYLDNTFNLLNAKPCWKKADGNAVFPEPGFREYDFSDARYVYKLTRDLSQDDLIALYPDMKKKIQEAESGTLDASITSDGEDTHLQKRTYPKPENGSSDSSPDKENEGSFDLIERYYKKFVEKVFVGDKQTGKIEESVDADTADKFVADYQTQIQKEQEQYAQAQQAYLMGQQMPMPGMEPGQPTEPVEPPSAPEQPGEPTDQPPAQTEIPGNPGIQPQQPQVPQPPIAPTPKNPDRFFTFKRQVPEIWCFAHVPGIDEPMADDVAWFYPKWKAYPFIPYFARFSTAPLEGDDRHLLVQGIVHGVKGSQEKHNKAEMLLIRHLNTAANSGWLAQEDSWVDRKKVETFGTAAGVNLEYKKGSEKPERITPMPLSQGHAQIALDSAEAIKAALGMNADLIAAQEGGGDSGRAIALRTKQGLLMIQEMFDNLSRTRIIAGKFILSQLNRIFDTDTAKKVLGEAFLTQNFPPLMLMNPKTLQQEPMTDPKTGQPMQYDTGMAETLIAEVLQGDLGEYDVSVGEAVASDTMRMANAAELKDIATTYPGVIPPDILIEESQLPKSTKDKVLKSIQAAQAAAQAAASQPHVAPRPAA